MSADTLTPEGLAYALAIAERSIVARVALCVYYGDTQGWPDDLCIMAVTVCNALGESDE